MAERKTLALPPADEEAKRILAIQLDKPHGRRGDVVLTGLFVALIFAFAVLFWILPDKAMSQRENRTLAQMPDLTLESLMDGSFSADIAEYMADQFPGRDLFITLKAGMEGVLGKGGNNGVLWGKDGTLIPREDHPDTESLRENLSHLGRFSAYLAGEDIPMAVAVTGRSADVLTHALPPYYGTAYSDALLKTVADEASAAGLSYVDLATPERERATAGEYVYYRTDHHWTSLGAFYGYEVLAEVLGVTPAPLSAFERQVVADDFYGTAWSTAGAFWIAPDTVEFFRYDGDTAYTVTVHDAGAEKTLAGLYDEAHLSKKDKYSAFLGGNYAKLTVTGEGERDTLLLLKDSFANAAVPFLARHFDLVIVDLRYYKSSVVPLLDEYGIDAVLALYNIDSLTTPDSQLMLNAGIR